VDLWGGWADTERTAPWVRDTIPVAWSVTKTMRALAALVLVDRGDGEKPRSDFRHPQRENVFGVCVGLCLLEGWQRPGPIEVGLCRLVEAEIREPVLAWDGRDPGPAGASGRQ
jgi:Beta-lactamase